VKKVVIDFKPNAWSGYQGLLGNKRWGGVAKKYYDELFEFPPEEWGRMRREFGKITFVSDRHMPFVIQVIVVEQTASLLHLYVTEFKARER
jgi:hypothetical protein